jgi:hypothetical protein
MSEPLLPPAGVVDSEDGITYLLDRMPERLAALDALDAARKEQDAQDAKSGSCKKFLCKYIHKWGRTKGGKLTKMETAKNQHAIFQIFATFAQAFLTGYTAMQCCQFTATDSGGWTQDIPPSNIDCTAWNEMWWQVCSAFFFLTSVVAMLNMLPAWRQLNVYMRDEAKKPERERLLIKTEYFLGVFIRKWCEALPIFVLNVGLQGTIFFGSNKKLEQSLGPASYPSFVLSCLQLAMSMSIIPKGIYLLFFSPLATFMDQNLVVRKVFAFSACAPAIMFPIIVTFLMGYIRKSFALVLVAVVNGWVFGAVVPVAFKFALDPSADTEERARPPAQDQVNSFQAVRPSICKEFFNVTNHRNYRIVTAL